MRLQIVTTRVTLTQRLTLTHLVHFLLELASFLRQFFDEFQVCQTLFLVLVFVGVRTRYGAALEAQRLQCIKMMFANNTIAVVSDVHNCCGHLCNPLQQKMPIPRAGVEPAT